MRDTTPGEGTSARYDPSRERTGTSWKKDFELHELVAADALTPYRYCEYRVHADRSRPGGCGGDGTMFTGM